MLHNVMFLCLLDLSFKIILSSGIHQVPKIKETKYIIIKQANKFRNEYM